MDAAACIGCGACVAACPNASAALFTGAKIAHLGVLPQGQPERYRRAMKMVAQVNRRAVRQLHQHRRMRSGLSEADQAGSDRPHEPRLSFREPYREELRRLGSRRRSRGAGKRLTGCEYYWGVPGRLALEIKQTRPFSLTAEAALNIQRTADYLDAAVARVLKGGELVTRDPDIRACSIVMERRGAIERSRQGTDRRVITVKSPRRASPFWRSWTVL